ncbi:MAG: type II secretion system F family protein [Betaproteobacteria bacterium]|nr:type II secretion system F family protein [Betaproteobacteria bacterium]
MASYAYRAIDPQGRMQTGKMDAVNPIDLELRLQRLELDLVTLTPIQKSSLLRSVQVTRKELITFCFHLDQLLRAGVTIIDALTDLRDTVDNLGFKQTVATLLEDIEGGQKLSDAMAGYPNIFDNVFVALIRTGEQSGRLPDVLTKLTENLKWRDELGAQVQKAMMYPLVAGVVIVGVIIALMIFLVPQLAVTLNALTPNPPAATVALIKISALMRQYWYLVIGLPIALIAGAGMAIRASEAARYQLDSLILRLPIIGPMMNKIILARFSTFFAMMYQSGIGVLDCIRISEKVVGNRVIEKGLQRIGRDINEGAEITQAFQAQHLFPPLVLRMLKVGETTGGLDTALLNVSYFYDRDVRETIGRLQQLIQPVMTLVLGGLLIGILTTVFSPMYDVIAKVKF